MRKLLKKQKGFTILEVVVVIFIITMGLVGVLALITQNIQVQFTNKNNLIASQLAQEGLELVRSMRDTNWIAGNNWKGSGSGIDIVLDGAYAVDYSGITDVVDIGDTNANLKIDASGFYFHGAGTASIFNRLISVSDLGNYLSIDCEVAWSDRGKQYDYTISTILYDWR